jgi:hypothetical protein
MSHQIGKQGKRLLWVGALTFAASVVYVYAIDAPSSTEESQSNQEAVLKYLGPALKSCGGVARIDYLTACAAKDGTLLPFPAVAVRPPPKEASGLAAIRDIFHNDKTVSVSESPSGMIRITIGKPNSSILRTKVHSLTLSREGQYDEVIAIAAILGCKEVQLAERQLGFEEPPTFMHIKAAPSDKRAPHLPSRMRNLTVDQALDKVAKTFGGIVIYYECANANGKRLFSVAFTETP